nr:MAG TPA: Oligoribonuclease [Caudoviricetes sp.]
MGTRPPRTRLPARLPRPHGQRPRHHPRLLPHRRLAAAQQGRHPPSLPATRRPPHPHRHQERRPMNTQHDITVSGKPLNPPKPPAKPHMLLWIDTETTGLDPNQCELLEVGMQVTDLKAETRGGSLHLIVHPDNVRNWANHPEMLKAYEMHLANGLMLACAEAPKTGYDYKHTALNIHEFLNDQLSQYTLHPAGTNVDFDLRQLDVHLSRHLEHPITQGLHHRKLDLTSFRLADQAIGGNPYQNHAGTHRVQDCIRRDINDYTAYLDIIRTGTQGDRQ